MSIESGVWYVGARRPSAPVIVGDIHAWHRWTWTAFEDEHITARCWPVCMLPDPYGCTLNACSCGAAIDDDANICDDCAAEAAKELLQ